MNKPDRFKRALFPDAVANFERRRREYWIDLGMIVAGGCCAFIATALGLGVALLKTGVFP
jgi:hypothetical protein